MEINNLTENDKLTLNIVMELQKLSPDDREKLRRLVREEIPSAVEFIDAALSLVESAKE